MEFLSLTISLTELAQLAATITGAVSSVIEVRRSNGGKELSERFSFKEPEAVSQSAKYEQIFESENCRIFLRFRHEIKPFSPIQHQSLDLVVRQVTRQIEA